VYLPWFVFEPVPKFENPLTYKRPEPETISFYKFLKID
jgi:hypothetical protein